MSKSLTESAAEILAASLGSAVKDAPKGLDGEEDLGGSSTENPAGDAVGSKVAASAKEAPKPGTAGVPAEKVKKSGASAPVVADEEKNEEVEASGEELTEEEIEEYLNSLSEEELNALAEEADSLEEEGLTNLKPKLTPMAVKGKAKMAEEIELTEEEMAEARKAAVKQMVKDNMSSCKEDVDALFNGESLSEEFRNKATTIFEAAVSSRVEAIVEKVVAENEVILSESVAEIQEELSTQVDEYLNYVVENWLEENEVAVETGLRSEIAEDFMAGLKTLFAEHYIEVPEDKGDLVEELAKSVIEAEEKLAESVAANAEITKALNESKSKEILRKICEGLTEVQVQKIKALAEGVEFTSDGEYTDKLAVIRENYFPSKSLKGVAPQTVVETAEEPKQVNNAMDYYVNAITKQLPK